MFPHIRSIFTGYTCNTKEGLGTRYRVMTKIFMVIISYLKVKHLNLSLQTTF